jgi:hypothetical protein
MVNAELSGIQGGNELVGSLSLPPTVQRRTPDLEAIKETPSGTPVSPLPVYLAWVTCCHCSQSCQVDSQPRSTEQVQESSLW